MATLLLRVGSGLCLGEGVGVECEPHRGPGTNVVLDLTGEDVGHLAVHTAITGNTVFQASLLVVQMLYSLSGLEKHQKHQLTFKQVNSLNSNLV